MIPNSVLLKISCRGIKRKQRDLRNRGNLKIEKAAMLKRDFKENND